MDSVVDFPILTQSKKEDKDETQNYFKVGFGVEGAPP
ncbi:MAG: hypothetical protein HW400_358 [Candidatus Levybacteria bacterium]|nr:hypothetical protein [Candidatus Levybacteria bacterium]